MMNATKAMPDEVHVMNPYRTHYVYIGSTAQLLIVVGLLCDVGYARARDGVWLPLCDRAQYERGERTFEGTKQISIL